MSDKKKVEKAKLAKARKGPSVRAQAFLLSPTGKGAEGKSCQLAITLNMDDLIQVMASQAAQSEADIHLKPFTLTAHPKKTKK